MVVQILIALLGITAVWLSQDARRERQRYACIFGLIGQPLWFYTTWQAGQWGIFVLSFAYTLAWIKGVRVYWLEKNHHNERECQERRS